jgi:hypothetical protein
MVGIERTMIILGMKSLSHLKSIRIDVIGVLASIIVISNNSKGSISYPFVFAKDSAFYAELLDLFSCLFKKYILLLQSN